MMDHALKACYQIWTITALVVPQLLDAKDEDPLQAAVFHFMNLIWFIYRITLHRILEENYCKQYRLFIDFLNILKN